MRVGILAEDATDCDAIGVLIRRIADSARIGGVGVTKAWGKGCARMRAKAAAKLRDMARDGCRGAVLLHDLDRNPSNGALNDESGLRAELESIERPSGLTTLICIPVEEIEAWFWSDDALVKYIGRGSGSAHPSPHLISKPKEALIDLSIGKNRKPRYTTNENANLAGRLDMAVCGQACSSFAQFHEFVRHLIQP